LLFNKMEISKSGTLFIFDWDDTLMCTTFMDAMKIDLQSKMESISELWTDLDKLSSSVLNILTTAMSLGKVVIITNAEEKWVEYSAQKFMPELIPILRLIRIISARTEYEKKYPGKYILWKFHAMSLVVNESIKNVLSIGDSIVERESVMLIDATTSHDLYRKSIKLADKPSIVNLHKQLELLNLNIKQLTGLEKNLDLQLKVEEIKSSEK